MKLTQLFGTIFLFYLSFSQIETYSQVFNTDAKSNFISHNIPKSPESVSFEKYGTIPVGEYTGTPNISVPLYELSNNGLNVPIALNYHASGIKVSQEATWVGLGWDLVPGGRITLEVKGGYDKLVNQYFVNQVDKNILAYLFKIGNKGNPYTAPTTGVNRVFSPGYSELGSIAAFCDAKQYGANLPTDQGFDRVLDYYAPFIKNFVEYGVGEPDIYHVNILNKSFSFYRDLLTQKIIVMGEDNLFVINESEQSSGSSWTITDDDGITYFFEQQEQTHYMSFIPGLYPATTTSWLLSKIMMTNGEQISYTYNNYGDMITAPAINESESWIFGETSALGLDPFTQKSNINNINDLQYIKPQYLTKIETKNQTIDFVLGYRNDIGGLGSRKLDKIEIRNKLSSELLRTIDFNYDYTGSETVNGYYFNLSLLDFASNGGTTVQERLKWRLRLNSININGSDLTNVQTYRFVYNANVLPSKVSISQDHWGYYNGRNQVHNGGSSNVSFTPSINSLIEEGIIPNATVGGLWTSAIGGYPIFISPNLITNSLGGHANRTADEQLAQAGMLTSIIYPTGGWTNFEYELHRSALVVNEIKGGGLRIKKISNFKADNEPTDVTSYEYENEMGGTSGVYLGSLDYLGINNYLDEKTIRSENYCDIAHTASAKVTLFSNGNLVASGPTIGYRRVSMTKINYLDQTTNGKIIKRFNANTPERLTLNITDVINHNFLPFSGTGTRMPPALKNELDGQLLSESYYTHSGVLQKEIINHYTQHNILDTIYSMRVADHKLRQDPSSTSVYYIPVIHYEPMRVYRTTLDSTIVSEIENGNVMLTRTVNQYNNYNQRETTTISSSDGGATVEYMATPLTFNTLPTVPNTTNLVGNALAIQQLRIKNILKYPVEKVIFKRKPNLDDFAVDGFYNVFDSNSNIKEIYRLETNTPIAFFQFQKSFFDGYDLVKDSHYDLKQTASYYLPSNNLKQLTENDKSISFLIDPLYNTVNAVVKNSKHSDIAYSSFEDLENGNWTLNGGTVNNLISHTGDNSYNLSSGSSINANIVSEGNYIVSYWLSSGEALVNGMSSVPVSTNNGWSLHHHKITLPANGSISISGIANIDELRLYPEDADFSSFTYHPLVGITSSTDSKSLSTYYEYDNFQRLRNVKNHKRNVIKNYAYNYNPNISTIVRTEIYFNDAITVNLQKQCPSGQTGSFVPYTVRANRYYSFLGKAAANQLAQDDINANAQNNANSLGTCGTTPVRPTFTLNYSFQTQGSREFQIAITDAVSGQTEYYYMDSSSSGSLPNIPGGTGSISINELNYAGTYTFALGSASQSGVYVVFNPITMTGEINLIITEQ